MASDRLLTPETIFSSANVRVSCDITNTGKLKGDEIVQLYIRDLVSSVTTYEKNLRGFERISLKPGETKKVSFIIKPDHLSLLDKNMNRIIEPGEFKVMIGSSSEEIRLKGKFFVKK